MSLLSASQIAAIRRVGELGMTVDVTIRRKQSYVSDDDNPFGDDTVTYETIVTQTKGWMLSAMGRNLDESPGGRIISSDDFTLRLPVGTVVDHRDTVTIAGADYTVIETNDEDTWAEWKVVYLKRIV